MTHRNAGVLLGGLLFALLLLVPRPAAALDYRGEVTLYQDTVWSGTVLIDGILTVAPGVTLEIRPGTEVLFTPMDSNGDGIGEHELFIQGTLLALGSAAEPIRFGSSLAEPTPGAWGAINMMAAETPNRLEYVQVESAYRGFHAHFSRAVLRDCRFAFNQRGLQFQESTVLLERCRIEANHNGLQFRDSQVELRDCLVRDNRWGVRCVYSEVQMRGCRIEANRINGANFRDSQVSLEGNRIAGNRKGLYLQRCSGVVAGNDLLTSLEHGILLEQSDCQVTGNRMAGNGRAGVKWLDSQGTLQDNDLAGNGEHALINEGAGAVPAARNYWGTREPAALAALVRDGRDRVGLGLVDQAGPLAASPRSTPVVPGI